VARRCDRLPPRARAGAAICLATAERIWCRPSIRPLDFRERYFPRNRRRGCAGITSEAVAALREICHRGRGGAGGPIAGVLSPGATIRPPSAAPGAALFERAGAGARRQARAMPPSCFAMLAREGGGYSLLARSRGRDAAKERHARQRLRPTTVSPATPASIRIPRSGPSCCRVMHGLP